VATIDLINAIDRYRPHHPGDFWCTPWRRWAGDPPLLPRPHLVDPWPRAEQTSGKNREAGWDVPAGASPRSRCSGGSMSGAPRPPAVERSGAASPVESTERPRPAPSSEGLSSPTTEATPRGPEEG
jgi:hypothetical protein